MMQGPEDTKHPRRWARRATVAVAAVVMVGAGVGVGMAVDAQPSDEGHDAMDHDAGSQASKMMDWAHKYGVDRKSMSRLPDVAKATDEERKGAADLLKRTKDATAQYADPDKAKAAGYDLSKSVKRVKSKRPMIAKKIERMDKGDDVKKPPTIHVGNKAAKHDGKVLDPSKPETLMYAYAGHDKWQLIGVMYTAKESYPDAPPNPAGPILRWHYHDHGAAGQHGGAGGQHGEHGKHGQHANKKGGHGLMTHVFFPPDNDLAKAYATTWNGGK